MLATPFTIPLWADLTAVAVGSLQGAMFAAGFRDRRIDLLGVATIGFATGLGGGLLRDLLLVTPPVALQTNWYLPIAVLAALVGMLLARLFRRLDALVIGLDALTIGLFGAIGASKALAFGLPEVPAIFVGVIAAVGGGVLRDILLGIPIAVMHVGSLYAVAAAVGTIMLVGLFDIGVPITIAAIVCVVATTVIRLLAVRFGWSLPEQRALSQLPRPRWPRRTGSAHPATSAIPVLPLQSPTDTSTTPRRRSYRLFRR